MVKWKSSAEKYLIDNYLTMTDEEIGKRLNKSRSAVQIKRVRLGIAKERAKPLIRFNRIRSKVVEINALINLGDSQAIQDRIKEVAGDSPLLYTYKRHIKGKEYSLERKALAYELYICGLNFKQIANEMKLNERTTTRWIKSFWPYTGNNSKTIILKSKI